MTQPTIDPSTFDELKSTAGAEFALELVDTFLAEAPAMLGALRQAYADGNAEAFRRAAHSLKSNGNTFGAKTFAAMAKELELGGMAPVKAASGAPLDAFGAEYARVAAALQEIKRA